MKVLRRLAFAAILFIYSISLTAQVDQSPYSINGIGDLKTLANASQFGMGGIGIATPSRFNINNMNPALLPYNTLSSFSMGLAVDYRSLSTEDLTQKNGGALLNNVIFSFPVISNKWSMSVGVMPFSSVNYNIKAKDVVPNTTIPNTLDLEGTGGLAQAYFANGILLTKGLSIGLRGAYIFGSIDNTSTSQVDSTNYKTIFNRQTVYGDLTLGGGLHYRHQKDEETAFSIGFTFDPKSEIKGNSTSWLLRTTSNNQTVPGRDTLQFKSPGSFVIPAKYGFGISYEKQFKLTIGGEFKYEEWSHAKNFTGNTDGFKNVYSMAVGAEWIPDFNSVSSYLARVAYRIGFSYAQSPYIAADSEVNDFGINFGWSLPIARGSSSLDMGFRLGQRGNLSSNPVRERYFQSLVGITINDRWFVRRRYD
ncbi:MAG: hypothetical protein O2887_00200 [Bacteroidetes bacterium]|nr:hypothetical protein [Bacteroidota bacterium]MDA1118910.1 hypothetical protein [Bacteroidota bacterium]